MKKKLSVNIILIVLLTTSVGSTYMYLNNTSTPTEVPEALYDTIFEDYPETVDIQTSGYNINSEILPPKQDMFWKNYTSGSAPSLYAGAYYLDTIFQDNNYGNSYNLLNPSGVFRIDPAILPIEYSPDIVGPTLEWKDEYGKYGTMFDEYVDNTVLDSVKKSHYTNSWMGQIGDEDTKYSIIFPIKDGFDLKEIGIGFGTEYARFIRWGSTETSVYNNDWIKGATWSRQMYSDPFNGNYSYLGDNGKSLVMMPTENVLAERIYFYRILYSDDYYNWYETNNTLLTTNDDYDEYWDGSDQLFTVNNIPDRRHFELMESEKTAKARSISPYYQDPFNAYTSAGFRIPSDYNHDNTKADPIISASKDAIDMKWHNFDLNENPGNIKPKYIQIKIEKTLYTRGSMFGLGRSPENKFMGVPEIGEIKLRYNIDKITDYSKFTGASINNPKNNSLTQVELYDKIPLDFSFYYKAENMLVNSATSSIDDFYFFLNNNENIKYTLLNNNPIPYQLVLNPLDPDSYIDYNYNTNQTSWIDSNWLNGDEGYFVQNPTHLHSNYIDLEVQTSTAYGGLYDIVLELYDIGNTDLDILYNRKNWDSSDINMGEFGEFPTKEYTSGHTITSHEDNEVLLLNDDLINHYYFNIPQNYTTDWEKGTFISFDIKNNGSYLEDYKVLNELGQLDAIYKEIYTQNEDYIAFSFNASVIFNLKDENQPNPSNNEYIKENYNFMIPLSGNWSTDYINTIINTNFNNMKILNNNNFYNQLQLNEWNNYTFNELGIIVENYMNDLIPKKYTYEIGSNGANGLYSFNFTDFSIISINNENDNNNSIYIDDVEVINFPFVENIFNSFELSYKQDGNWKNVISTTPNVQDIFLKFNENMSNPINNIGANTFENNIYTYYDIISQYLGKSINYTFQPILMNGSEAINFRIKWLNTYQYSDNYRNSYFYHFNPTYNMFQFGNVNIKNIHAIPTNVEKSWKERNNIPALLSQNQDYLQSESDLKSVVVRNAFYGSVHSDDVSISYSQNNMGEYTKIYSNSPISGQTYFQTTLNLPVSTYYDICFRDSFLGNKSFDNNSYAIYINDELYRVFYQSNYLKDNTVNYNVNGNVYESILTQSYTSLNQIPIQSQEYERRDVNDGEIIRVASDFFNSGYYNIKIVLFENNDDFVNFRYDQILLFHKSFNGYEIPVMQFEELNSLNNTHTITIHIKNPLDDSINRFSTQFDLYVKPYINFNGGFLPDHLQKYSNIKSDAITQEMFITESNKNNLILNAIMYGNNINMNTVKYKINDQEYTVNPITEITELSKNMFEINVNLLNKLDNLTPGTNIISISCTNQKNINQESFLVVYYDIENPEIALVESLSNVIKENENQYNTTSDVQLVFDVSDNLQINEIYYNLGNEYIVGSKTYDLNHYVYKQNINLYEIQEERIQINVSLQSLKFGNNEFKLYVIDKANNIEILEFILFKEGNYIIFDTSEVDWINYDTFNFNTSIKILKEYETSNVINIQNFNNIDEIKGNYIKIGKSDIDSYEYIEQTLIISEGWKGVLKSISLYGDVANNLKDTPLKVEIFTSNYQLLSESIIYIKENNVEIKIEIPEIITIYDSNTLIIRLQPMEAEYNIFNLLRTNTRNIYQPLYGIKNNQRILLPYRLAFIYSIETQFNLIDYETKGNIRYELNGFLSPLYINGEIDITINNSVAGINTLTIYGEYDGRSITENIYYLWFNSSIHYTPNIDFIYPQSSVYSNNITILFTYSYPGYETNYDFQIYLYNSQFDTEYYLSNFTISSTELKYGDNFITFSFDSNKTYDEMRWLMDSSHYYIKVVLESEKDGDIKNINRFSDRFTITNEGIIVKINSPEENMRFNTRILFDIDISLYDGFVKSSYYYFDNNINEKRTFSYNTYRFRTKGELKIFSSSHTIDISKLLDGEYVITFVFIDNNNKISFDSKTFIKDTYNYANILEIDPQYPSTDTNIIIKYENLTDYKVLEVYMVFRLEYGNEYGFKMVDKILNVEDSFNGEYNLGRLELGIYDITLRFYDEAGNMAQDSEVIEVVSANKLINLAERFKNLILGILGGGGSVGIIYHQVKKKDINEDIDANIEKIDYSQALNKYININKFENI